MKKFSWRAFISFGLTYSFIIILFSGIILYMAPPGRYANWVNWKIINLTKEGWQSLHTVFSYSFVILSIFHLFTINWKAFLSYLKKKKEKGLNKKTEFFLASILTLVFAIGVLFSVPPFKSVMDFGEYLTESWEKVEEAPPVPHAELLTLVELADELRLSSVDEITRKLDLHKIVYQNTDVQTLKEIAEVNEKTPIEIYEILTRTSGSERQGSGIGRKSIEDFALELNKSVDEVIKILESNNIKVEKGQTLREIGNNNNIPPRDIFDLIDD